MRIQKTLLYGLAAVGTVILIVWLAKGIKKTPSMSSGGDIAPPMASGGVNPMPPPATPPINPI